MAFRFKYLAVSAIALLCSMTACAQVQAPGDLLDKAAFDTEIDGKPVSLYTITNGRITAQVTNYAGYIVGIYTPDKDGNYANVVSHNETIQQYTGPSRAPLGAALGRYANRIGNASFTLDGVKYELTKNNGAHTLHGGTKGFDHTVWDVEKVTDNSVVMSCVLPDGTDGFPGTLKTTLTFSVTKDDGVFYSNTSYKPFTYSYSTYQNVWSKWDDAYGDFDWDDDYESAWDDLKITYESCEVCPMVQECSSFEVCCSDEVEALDVCADLNDCTRGEILEMLGYEPALLTAE